MRQYTIAYYYDHRLEIDEAIKDSKDFVEALRQQTPSKVAQKLNELGMIFLQHSTQI